MTQVTVRPNWFPERENEELILNFILYFSRIEYAMKNACRFHKINKRLSILEPNWSEMRNYMAGRAIPLSLREAMIYVTTQPPNKQADHQTWYPIQGNSDWPFLIDVLKTVRNNLFHGGKHYTGQILAPVRDVALLTHCLNIMRELISIAPQHVQIIFDTA